MSGPPPPPTNIPAEVAAYFTARAEYDNRRWRRRNLGLLLTVLASIGSSVYVANVSTSTNEIVQGHTNTLTNQARCQDQAFDAILKDARLAFTGDKNPNDYAKAPRSC